MPSVSYAANKKHIYAWREKNYDHFLRIQRDNQRKYDAWKREKKIFLNILLI